MAEKNGASFQANAGIFVVIPINGVIIHNPAGSERVLNPDQDPVETILDQLEIADKIKAKAVILDISSPGGEVGACEEIRKALMRLRHKGVAVIAYARSTMASGAYYISTDANSIVAAPSAMVGNIGVIMQLLNFEDLAGKVGVRVETIKSAPMKDVGSPFRRMTPQERAMFQQIIDEAYKRFRQAVASGREINLSQMEIVASGEAFTATRAKYLRLVDLIGDLQTAVDAAMVTTGITAPEVITYKKNVSIWDLIIGGAQEKLSLPLATLDKSLAPHLYGPRLLYQWMP